MTERSLPTTLIARLLGLYRGPAPGIAVRVKGGLAERQLRSALALMVARHDMLRARLPESAMGREMAFRTDGDAPLEVADLTSLSEAEAGARVAAAFAPIDHDSRLWRASLLSLGGDSILCMAHALPATDGASSLILLNETLAAYSGHALPPAAPHYQDYLRWADDYMAGPRGQDLDAYWRSQAEETHAARLTPRTLNVSHGTLRLSSAELETLAESSLAHEMALSESVMASYAAALHLELAESSLLMAMPFAGRPQRFQRTLGRFACSHVFPTSMSPPTTVEAFATSLSREVRDALPFAAVGAAGIRTTGDTDLSQGAPFFTLSWQEYDQGDVAPLAPFMITEVVDSGIDARYQTDLYGLRLERVDVARPPWVLCAIYAAGGILGGELSLKVTSQTRIEAQRLASRMHSLLTQRDDWSNRHFGHLES